MVGIAIIILVPLIIGGVVWYTDYLFDGFLASVVSLIVTFFLVMVIGIMLPLSTTKVEETPLKALSLSNGQSGTFFLGTGVIKDKIKYIYYLDNGGRYELKTIDADDADIVEYDGEPKMVKEHLSPPSWWLPAMDDFDWNITFYVPEGSITDTYELDVSGVK